jgi:acetoacetyl-CoA reductase
MSNRVALVTGGTGGIGTAICKALADAGCTVVAGTTRAEKGEAWQAKMKEEGYDMHFAAGDVTDHASCQAMVQAAEAAAGGPIDVLVNNAGITKDGRFVKMSPENWSAVIKTNLDSVYNVTSHVVGGMTERGFGRVINISSVNGEKGQFGQCNYSAAKAGMHGFTMALAQETAAKGVTVNTVSPGYIGTEMVMAMKEEAREKIAGMIPARRLGKPEEVAKTAVFIFENDYISGRCLEIDGALRV